MMDEAVDSNATVFHSSEGPLTRARVQAYRLWSVLALHRQVPREMDHYSEVAQHIANHQSPRTTKLYDRRQDEISLDEIERIAI